MLEQQLELTLEQQVVQDKSTQTREEVIRAREARKRVAQDRRAQTIRIYTDGGCAPNPGAGGWGFLVTWPDGSIDERYGGQRQTTNNRMEMIAAINALNFVNKPALPIMLYTDSQYLQRGAVEWLGKWRAKKFRGVKNPDLWREIDCLIRLHEALTWRWVRGHNGLQGNVRADELATAGRLAVLS